MFLVNRTNLRVSFHVCSVNIWDFLKAPFSLVLSLSRASKKSGTMEHKFLLPIILAYVLMPGACKVLSSTHFAQKGERCGADSKAACDPGVNLECSQGVCECKSGYTISRNGTKCLEIARNGLESPCEESIQCWKSLLGRLSECNIGTNKCSCYESETIPIVYHQGRCYYGETLGEDCQIEGLCSKTTSNAVCRMDMCHCKEGYVQNWDKSRCLPIATQGVNSSCEENIQCEKSQLGSFSECNQDRMQCECYQIPQVPTVLHLGRCYFGAGLGDPCQVSSQCTAKVRNAYCGKDGKCRCQLSFHANENQTHCLPTPTTTVSPLASDAESERPECTDREQCQSHGYFSRCNLTRGKCECYNPDTSSVIKDHKNNSSSSNSNALNGKALKCYSSKYLGQTCKFQKQCSEATENSVCNKGLCECNGTSYITSTAGRKCLEIASKGLDSPCEEDSQCTRSSLGPLSVCNVDRKTCECTPEFPVIYHHPKCYLRRKLGSSCESHFECRESSESLAECVHGRCQCGQNSTQSANNTCVVIETLTVISSGAGNFISYYLTTYFWMLTALVVDKYTGTGASSIGE